MMITEGFYSDDDINFGTSYSDDDNLETSIVMMMQRWG